MTFQVIQETEPARHETEQALAQLQADIEDLRSQVARLESHVSALSENADRAFTIATPNNRQLRDQLLSAIPELRLVLKLISPLRKLVILLRMVPQAPRYGGWFALYWLTFAWLARTEQRSPRNFESVRSMKTVRSLPEPIGTGSGPVHAAYQLYLRSLPDPRASLDLAVNEQQRDTSDEAIEADLAHAVEVGLLYLDRLPHGTSGLKDIAVLEVGPGINYGCAMMLACHGAKVMVADRFLPPWDDLYHPRFYSRLKDWVCSNLPGTDTSPFDRLLAEGWHCPEAIGSVAAPLENLSCLPEGSMDMVLSNAVFEHLYDPKLAIGSLARISRTGAFGLHQVDFRDHRDFGRPLGFLLLSDGDFTREFEECHGECGNRFRPSEMTRLFEENGFSVNRFEPNLFAEDAYMEEFLPQLRAAGQSKYQGADAVELRTVSGMYTLVRK
jgi:hypothetical protein